MLAIYLKQTRRLLQLPGTNSTSLYTDTDLTDFINISRGQLAGEAECIRVLGTIPTAPVQQAYAFASITLGGTPTLTGVQAAIHVRSVRVSLGVGSIWIPPKPWEWFELYELNNVAPLAGTPRTWSQYGQGAAPGNSGSSVGGSFYVSPPPDISYVLNVDCVCWPQPLVTDMDVEAIPYQYTDAVPFFAAYYALLSAQTNARMNDALNYYKMYNEFMQRARRQSNATPNRWQYEQAQDPVQAAKLGATSAKGGV